MSARAAALALLCAGFALTFLADPWQDELVSDIPLYHSYAELFSDGVMPYRDVGFEYPPLAAPLIALPGLVSLELDGYRLVFAAIALALAAGLVLAAGRLAAVTGGDRRLALLGTALAPLLLGTSLRTHFDLAPVLCLVAGLAAVAAVRPRLGFALLGVGGALKAFPLLAVPVAAAWLAARGCAREAAVGVALAVGVVALAVAGALLLSPGGAWDAVDYHLERPVQIESMPASILNAIEAAGGRAAEPIHSHRSDGLEHPASAAIEAAFLLLLAAWLAGVFLAAWRAPDARGLALCGLAAVAGFAALGKVISPQFMVWLVPLAALAWAWGMRVLAACTAAAIAATLLWFPGRYFDLVAREDWAAGAVGLRNALLAAMLVLLARELAAIVRGSPAAGGSTPPGRRGEPRPAPR